MLLMRHAGSPALQPGAGGSEPPVPSRRTPEQGRVLCPAGTGKKNIFSPSRASSGAAENEEQTQSSSLHTPWLQGPHTGSGFCNENCPGGAPAKGRSGLRGLFQLLPCPLGAPRGCKCSMTCLHLDFYN